MFMGSYSGGEQPEVYTLGGDGSLKRQREKIQDYKYKTRYECKY